MVRSFWKTSRISRFRPVLEGLEERVVPSTYSNLADSGAGSLRQAIADAPFGDTISAAPGLSGVINLAAPLDNGFKALTIVGQTDGSGTITLDGGGMHRMFNARGNENVSFSNLTFANGTANTTGSGAFGGAVQLDHNHQVTFTNCVFNNNTATGGAGAIDASGGAFGTLTLTNCTFTGNTASGPGGAVSLEGYNAIINNSTFTNNGNSTTTTGGAIDASGSPASVTITGGSFSGNQASPTGHGGAINLVLYSGMITGTSFTNNQAGSGGAIDVSGLNPTALLSLTTCTFTTNMTNGTTSAFGGALEVTNVSTNITGSTFTGNTALITGGATNGRAGGADLFANQAGYAVTFNLIDSSFVNNMANGSGGLIISLQSGSSADVFTGNVQGCTFDGNTSTSTGDSVGFGGGGNFYAQGYSADFSGDNGSATISVGRSANGPTEFKNNKSGRFGGGLVATAYASYGASAAITLGDSNGATPSLLIHDNSSTATSNPLLGGGAYLQTKSQPNAAQTTTPFASVVLQHADVYNNSTTALTSSNGGGLYIENDSLAPTGSAEVDVFSSEIHDNTTVGQGGGAFVGLQSLNATPGVRSKVVFINDTIYQNSTTGDPTASQGGGLFISRVLSGNSAVEADLNSLTVAKNTAAAQGGNLAVINDSALTVNSGNSIYSNGVSGVTGISADVFGMVSSTAGPGMVGGYNILLDNSDGNHGFADPTDQVGVDPQLDLATGLFLTSHSALKVLGFLSSSSPAINTGDSVNMAGNTDETDWIRPATPTIGAYDPNAMPPMILGGGPMGGPSADPAWASAVAVLLSSRR
jgi:hypothetical protein